MVAGSLLGLDVDGILEVTYAYPFPIASKTEVDEEGNNIKDELDGQDYQIEMMKMLRDVNLDNNCVGWYQSTYMGTFNTNEVVGYQESYQSAEDLSDNSIMIIYDPIQTKKGHLLLKAYRLSDEYMKLRKLKKNHFIKPTNILVEIPIKIKNSGYLSAFLYTLSNTHAQELNCAFDSLTLSGTETYVEKNLELMSSWTDDLISESNRFQQYNKIVAKQRSEQIKWLNHRHADNIERRENGETLLSVAPSDLRPLSTEPPPKFDTSLIIEQLNIYNKQIHENVETQIEKLYITKQLFQGIN